MKTLITALLTASALFPAAAQAQRFGAGARIEAGGEERADRPDRGGDGQRGDRPSWRQRADAGASVAVPAQRTPQADDDRPQFRQERRDERQDFRQERRGDRQDLRSDAAVQRQFRDDRRDIGNDRQDFRGSRDDAARGRPGWQNYSAFRDGRGGTDQRYGAPGYAGRRDGYRPGGDGRTGAWNRDWRSNGRYDWNRYRTVNRGAYRLPRYYAPSGWGYGYRRFAIGVTLAAGLWDQNYWIDDPYAYRLPDAYGPYRWVRYYDDALLIDIRNGRVVDTVYGIFY